MTDNTTLNKSTSSGDVIATDDIAGVKYQRVKLVHGADGVNDGDVASGNPLPTILYGLNDAGDTTSLNATPEGHLEVALHSPRLPFGSIHTESLTPVFQSDGIYGVNTFMMATTNGLAVGTGSNSGSVTGAGNRLVIATGTTQYSFATLQSRRRLRYRPGQGVIGRFACFFSTPAANSIVVSGFGTSESGIFFGYNGTSFGILYSTGGVREIHTLTITTASTATNDYVVTLPNTATVTVSATNNASTTRTAYEIAQGTFPGWTAAAQGATVVFLRASAGPTGGSFSLAQTGAGTPAAGTDATTLAGVAATDTWIPQASWNGDPLDGSGPSGFTLAPSKGNVYQVGVQYLGSGTITFDVEVTYADGNNPEWARVHTLKIPNTQTAVSLTQPAFPFTAAAYSAGSTTNVSVSVGSYAGFIEGDINNIGPRSSYYITSAVTSSISAFKPLFTVKNSNVFAGRANQTVGHLIDVNASVNGNTNSQTILFVVRNAVLTGPTNFTQFSSYSSTYWDTTATACTFEAKDVIWSGSLAQADSVRAAFSDREITLQPGESISVVVRSTAATATCIGSLNIREDQ